MRNKIIDRVIAVTACTAGLGAAYIAGFVAGTPTTAPHAEQVNVSIVYEESGEAREVTLTDSEGNPVELGSVAEEWPWVEG